ncbi:MAG TPA: hypothetical protein ENJ95_22595 [Bacteroidetes bacterium]|nr:hypothetical protein [Bacteroidota bacterium]
MKNIFVVILIILLPAILFGQSDKPSKWQVQGYLKYLNASTFIPAESSPLPIVGSKKFLLNDNLLHNRLKFKYFANEQLTFHAELRNRVFWGDQVRFTLLSDGDFIENINLGSDGFFDWSAGHQNSSGYALHTTLDRFYAEWSSENWELRLGRQRINWGIGTIWNPNDIFNAYNFTDFDYEERPGSDALRVKRYLGFASSIEIAVNAFRKKEEAVGAVKANFHSGTYDWQVLAGVVEEHLSLGGGWAGNVGNASFKGEAAAFFPLTDSLKTSYALSLGVDYTFDNQLYINSGILYNSNGTTSGGGDLFTFQLSARNLYPYKYSILTQLGYPITPLLNSAFIVVYSPGNANALFLNPVLSYSLSQNWDLDLVGQLFFSKGEKYRSAVDAGFVRIKWSF